MSDLKAVKHDYDGYSVWSFEDDVNGTSYVMERDCGVPDEMKSKFKDDGISFSVPVTPFRFPKILDPTKRTKSRRSEAEAQPGTGVESWVQQHVLHWKKLLNRDDIVKRLVDLVNEGNEEKVAREVKENEVAALVEKNKVAELVEEKEIADESREGKVLAVADEKVPAPVDKEVSPDSSRAAKKQRIE